MRKSKPVRLRDHFADLSDPRRRKVTYLLINVIVIAICGVICGARNVPPEHRSRHFFN